MKTRKIIYLLAVTTLVFTYAFFSGCKKKPELPTVTTGEITQITDISAIGSGEVTKDGNSDVTLKGLCWGTTPEPTILNFFMNSTSTGVGSFTCNIIALQANTQYYVRAFAINEVGTAYGNTVSFTTLPPEIPVNAPVVATGEVSNITETTAVCGGLVVSDAGYTVTARGVCWSQNSSPTIADSKTNNGEGAGSFTSNITGLSPNTTYYLRAYATNSNGTGYGSTMSFKTKPTSPTVTTAEISNITGFSATSGGNVTTDGGASVTARGVCWSISENPTTANSKTNDGSGTGSYTSNITGLSPNTTYYVRAYATNSAGTAYGEQRNFTTTPPACSGFTDSRDGNYYPVVLIGDQCWMAKNLAYLPSVVGSGTGSNTTAYYYVYGYAGTSVSAAKATANYTTYGVLYNWTAAMNSSASSATNPSGVQGICPAGWHLPSDAEWTQLTNYLGGTSVAGGKLKETGTTHWNGPNTGATNETGFTALPGGFRLFNGDFSLIGNSGYWWSATEHDTDLAWYRRLYYYDSDVYRSTNVKELGFSVRCLRDY